MLKSTFVTTIGVALPLSLAVADENPYAQPDDSWISISGIVSSTADEQFNLDYGEGTVIVEMDNWDWYDESVIPIEGDTVTVYGRVDDDLYEITTIEAGSVYVEDLNTYFYASDADEEEFIGTYIAPPTAFSGLTYTGTVNDINGREFTLDTGAQELTVDTIGMNYNPMDDQGYQQIRKGDIIQVSGHLDYDVFEERELAAESIVTLVKDKTKRSGRS